MYYPTKYQKLKRGVFTWYESGMNEINKIECFDGSA